MYKVPVMYIPADTSRPGQSMYFYTMQGLYNPFTWDRNFSRVNDIPALYAAVYATSHNSVVNYDNSMSFFHYNNVAGAYVNFRDNFGFTNGILASALSVDDKFVFKNGNYMIVTRVSEVSGVRFDYCLANGTQVYQNVDIPCGGSTDFNRSYGSIPFLSSFENINDFTIRGIVLYSYTYQGAHQVGGDANNLSKAPVSYNLALEFWTGIKPVDPYDPYAEIGDSEPSGPAEGVGYPEDELVPIPSLPSVSVTDTGFVTLFNPTLAEVKSLASYMWAGLFDLNTFKKIFADPMDCILGFNMLPVAIPDGGTAEVVVGNISTGVTMTKASGQWVEVDCGSLDIDKPFGNYLDYSPYMKYSIYLPYIGTVDLSADDIMGHTIHLVYHIDVLSCSCVAYLEVDGRVMYQWTGSCGYSIPVTGNDFRQMISNIVSIAATLGGAMVTGGMSAPMAAAAAAAGAATATNNVLNSKPDVHRSGSIGSSAGVMGMQKPYLIQQGPRICKPEKQYHYLGYPAFVTVSLGSVSGYQEFSNVILDGIPCTEEERDMIATACAGGIYL